LTEGTPIFGTKSDYAYQRLREMIAEGELAPGSRLVLRQLAETFGLSEMPVREALRMLQRDGLVEFQSHRGATVVSISKEFVIEGVSMRMWLQILAVEEAVPLHTAKTLAAARRELERGDEAAASGDGLEFSRRNRLFHTAIEAPAGELLRTTISELWDRVWEARRTLSLFVLEPAQSAVAQAEHLALMDTVTAGDAVAAGAAMARHRESSLAGWHHALGQPS
jgi:DNA-binding GntR family transcriptional regulator